MLNIFLYSIAGKKSNNTIDTLIDEFLAVSYISPQDKKILQHTKSVAEAGNYPSVSYYQTFYPTPEFTYKSLAEIVTLTKQIHDFYHCQELQKSVVKVINEANSYSELNTGIANLLVQDVATADDVDLSDYDGELYSDTLKKPDKSDVILGVSEIDEVTNGFMQGTVASICGFTGHGKTQTVISMMYRNASLGRKGCFCSLEVAPAIIWLMLETRYLYEKKGMSVSFQDLKDRKIPSDMLDQVIEAEKDFVKDIKSNLIVVDESFLPKKVCLDYKLLTKRFKAIEKKLGGLDVVAFDHVGQFELLYPDCGNIIIKQIQSFTKTYPRSNETLGLVSVLAVQANRQGEMRARKRNYCYDLQAISDLSEVERTSSYIVFLYTSDDMKIVQETRMTLAKHRLGAVISEPITVSFNPAVSMVGSAVEKVQISDDDFNAMDLGFNFDDEF